jgi:hypothetical protein
MPKAGLLVDLFIRSKGILEFDTRPFLILFRYSPVRRKQLLHLPESDFVAGEVYSNGKSYMLEIYVLTDINSPPRIPLLGNKRGRF